ncbi:MAG: hypothetical protein GX895_10325 [Clostridiales bacterium]|jgi:hypothetical protein|nr:hypothetical protein [Clostridiales bacterium]NLZ49158.1 hypothetical protein [Clostridiales bacterium]
MITKVLSKLNTRKKKVGTIFACSALAVALGAVTVSAATSTNTLQAKMVKGARSYSTDGGESWSEGGKFINEI